MAVDTCRKCSAQISASAKICPWCGVRTPTVTGNERAVGCFGLLAIVFVIPVAVAVWSEQKRTPEEQAKKRQEIALKQVEEGNLSDDYDLLVKAGALAVASGDADKYEISRWNHSLDLHIQNRLELKAAALAHFLCHQNFKLRKADWKIRVYLIDGSVGAECQMS